MGVGRREVAAVWALALALACAQHPGDPLLGVTILPPLKTTAVVRALNPAHNGRVCSTWGDSHYKTFDGDVFYFPGRCNYVLSAHCGAAYEDFNVQLRRGPNATTPSKVTMKLNGMVLELTEGSVLVDGRPTQLPFSRSGVLVEHSVNYLKVAARLGLVFMWNQDGSLLLELDPKYANQTCGLCGDFNGVPVFNELISHGVRLSPTEFGSLQKMDGPTEQCQDPVPAPVTGCSTGSGLCEELLLGERFQGCRPLVDASGYVQACRRDLCLCPEGAGRASCACRTLAEYSRQCAHAGGLPPDWRGPGLCPPMCPLDMQHRECGSPCADTCSNPEHSQACEDHCVAGCFCPEGTVLDDIGQKGCVPVSQCPCAHNGATYAPGAVYSTECSTCTCSGGRWSCREVACPGTCSVLGGAHFSTFDEKPYTVHGDCSYVLAKPCNGSAFTVLAELRRCGLTDSESCLRSLTLSLGGGRTVVTVQAGGEVFVDQVYAQLPVSAANITVFRPSTFFIIAQTHLGLQVDVQLVPTMQVFLRLAPELRGLTCGLCGNFNQNQADDFRTLSGVVEGTAAAFANTWKTQAACPNVRNSFEDPCALSVENEKYAQHWCSRLTDPQGPFARCHAAVSPGSYYSHCLFDTCNCEKSEDCLCAALSSYVRACAARGVLLSGWRAGVCAKPMENCPKSMTYHDRISTCQPTCRALSDEDPTCGIPFVPVDGCACPQGTFLDDGGECVPASSCPCYHGALVIPSGESVHQQGAVCTCTKGSLSCIGGHTPDPVCAPPMVYADCRNASAGATGAGCQKGCHTLDMDCYSPQCVPGCVCPDGLVADGEGGCVAAADCPCVHNEASYRAGQTIRVGCNTCTCRSRMWQCTDEPCLATCAVYGDGHYLTFDGQRYSFSGNCEYTLAQDHCGGNGSSQDAFRVVTENVPCGTTGTTCSKAIKIFLGSHELKLSDGKVEAIQKAAGQEAPYAIRQVGIYLVVDTEAGLLLLWDKKTSIFLRLSPELKGRVCGLCGNFDDNALNDFTTRSQAVVGDALEFGNSWKSSPSCPDAPAPKDPCTANPYRKSWAQKQCSLLNSATFQACHAHVDPTKYYEACVSDACACDSGGDCECFCTAVAAYAQACREAGVCVSWRTPDVCPLFCDYYNPHGECEWHYQPCGAPCLRTCRNPRGQCRHDTHGLEGCYPRCPVEAPIFDEDNMQCVAVCPSPPPPPPCQVQGKSYRPGAAVPSEKNCHSCICAESGVRCTYDADACVCTYGGQHFHPGDVIYHTADGTGGCISARCGANGTVERRVQACGPSTPTPTTTFSFSTAPIATSSTGRPSVLPNPATSPAPTGSPSRVPPTAAGTSPRPQPSTASASPHPGCGEDCQWSPWMDISRPGRGIDSGDFDTLHNLRAHGHRICQAPRAVECRAEGAPEAPLQDVGPRVECTPTVGLTCYNRDQASGLCDNYQIRVLCCAPRACPTASGPAPTTPRTGRSTAPRATSRQTGGPSSSANTRRTPAHSTPTPGETTPGAPGTVPVSTTAGTATSGSGTRPKPSEGPDQPASAPPSTIACLQEVCSWTAWIDGSYPGASIDSGDFDTFQNLRSKGYSFCERPRQVECRAASFPDTPLAELGQRLLCSNSVGLVCRNRDQLPPICYNYEVRIQCCERVDVCRPGATSVTPEATRPTTQKATTRSEATPTTRPQVASTQHRTASSVQVPPAATVTASTHITSPGTTSCQARCTWTKWFDVDFPSPGPHGGDLETYSNLVRRGEKICRRPEHITHLECRAENHPELSIQSVGQVVQCSPDVGLVCRNRDQRGTFEMCLNYEIRVLCCEPREGCPPYQPVTVPSTPSVSVTATAETTSHVITTRKTSVPGTSTTPVPETSTIPVPNTHTTPVPGTSTTPVPNTSRTSVPETSTTPAPETSTTPVPNTSTTPVPETSTTPVPNTSTTPVPGTSTTPVPNTSRTSVPETSTTPAPETSTTPVPNTSTIPVPETSTTRMPETSTTPVPGTSTTPVPSTSTTSVPTPATTHSTPGTTSCQPRCTWTKWFDVDFPSPGPHGGDLETYSNLVRRGEKICRRPEYITHLECRAENHPELSIQSVGQVVQCSPDVGLVCRNRDQRGPFKMCLNYEIRLLCCEPREGCPPYQPVTVPSTPSVSVTATAETTAHVITTRKTSVPGTSTTPVPETSTIPVPNTHTTPVPGTSTTPVPNTSRTSVPETSTTPAPETSTTPVPNTSTTPVPETSTTPVPNTSTTPVPGTSTTPVPNTSRTSVPETSTTPAPETSTTPVPNTSTIPVPETSTTRMPETSTTPVPGTSTTPVPSISTTSVPTPATTHSTPGTTTCQPRCTWTKWFDVDFPSPGPHGGDLETYSNLVRRGEKICRRPEYITHLECRAENHPELSIQSVGQVVQCSPDVGLVCRNRDQRGPFKMCLNYEIRLLCCEPREGCPPYQPVTVPSTPSVSVTATAEATAHVITTRKTSVPGTSTTPVPETSTIPVPNTHTTPVPGTSTTPVPNTSRTSVPETSTTPAPETSTTPVPNTSTTPVPETSTTPVPNTSTTPVPGTSTTPVPNTSRTSVPETSTTPAPDTSTTPVPNTSTIPVPETSTTRMPETSTTPVPGTSTTPVPSTSTTSVPTPATTHSTPGTTTCQPRCTWTKWFDVDFPSPGPHGGDLETYSNLVRRGEKICRRPEYITHLECRAENHPELSIQSVGQVVQCSPDVGLVCRNRDQRGTFNMCLNYEIRVLCCEPREGCPPYQPVTVPSTPSVSVTATAETTAHVITTRKTSVPGTSTTPVPETSTIPVPNTHTTPVPGTSTTPVPNTSRTSVPETSTTPAPETSTTPVPNTSTIPVPGTSTPPVPNTSRTSVPETSTTPVPETSTTPVPGTSTTPVPNTRTIPVPETSTIPVPNTSRTSVPETSTTPVPNTRTTPVSETSTTPVPGTSTTPVTETSTTPVPNTSTTPVPGTSTTLVPNTSRTSVPETSTTPVPKSSTRPVPETSTTPVSETSTTPVPNTSTTSVPTPATTHSTPGTTSCQPRCTWTKWFDVDFPSPGPHGGDLETYSNLVRRGEKICRRPEYITHLECRAENHPELSIQSVGQVVQCSPDVGLVCRNRDQRGPFKMCLNYEIRVLCCEPREGCPPHQPVTVPSTPSVSVTTTAETTSHVITTRKTSVPNISTTPVPETSTIPVPNTSRTPGPETSTTPVPKTNTTPVPNTRTIPMPETSTTPVPNTSTTSVPETSTTPMPNTRTTPVLETSTTPVPNTSTTSVPTPATTHSTPGTTSCQPRCTWTKWFDVDFPSPGPHGGDLETYSNLVRRGEKICRRPEYITHLECRAENHPELSIQSVGQVVQCSPDVGLVCRNRDQRGPFKMCLNYEIRVLCCEPREGCPPHQPVTVPSTPSVSVTTTAETTSHVITTRKTSVPNISTTPVPETSTIPVPNTSRTPGPETSTTPVPKTNTTPVPNTRTIPMPETSTTPVPNTSTTSVPETSTTPMPNTRTTPVLETSTTPVPNTSTTSVPTPATTHSTPGTTSCQPRCTWTKWFDVDFPSPGPHGGDLETYSNLVRRGEKICRRPEYITHLECRAENHPELSIQSVGQVVQCSPDVGLVCRNRDQRGPFKMCLNYEIRLLCCEPREGCPPYLPVTVPSTPSVSVTTTAETTAHVITTRKTSVPGTSTTPVPETSTIPVPNTHTTPVPGTSTTPVPNTSRTSVPETSTTPVPETSTTPVPNTSTIPVPGTSTPPVPNTSRTSVPETSTTPAPETSTTPVPNTSTIPVPGTSTPPVPNTSRTSVPETSTTPVPETSTTPVPGTSTTPVPNTRTIPVPKTSTIPVPNTSRSSVPETSTTPVPNTSRSSVPETSTTPVPNTHTTPVSETNTTPVPGTSTSPVTETSTTSVPTPATTHSTPGTTTCQPRCTWTKWFDVDFPSPGPHGGDLETYSNLVRRGEKICRRPEYITHLECRAENHPELSIQSVGQVVQCSPDVGLVCRNRDQRGPFKMCLNYEIRVLCCEPREGCPLTSATPDVTSSVKSLPTSEPTSQVSAVTSLRPSAAPPPRCFCSVSHKLYPAGSIIYQEADLAGHCYYAVCSLDCHVVRQTDHACPTRTVPPTPMPTPSPSPSMPGSSPSAPVPVTTQGCPSAVPPRTRGETWAMPNCSQATCEGNNVVTLQPRPCPQVQEPTCANGYPALKVADEDGCCQHYQCQCVCSGWGDPHYITFDGTYYTFLDNCTYVLVQQIVPVYGHFRVLIDNYFCNSEDGLSCPQSIIVEYRRDRVVLTRKPVRGVMTNEIIFNNEVVRPGFARDGVVVAQVGIKMYVSIPEIGVQVMFSGLIFSVEVPFSKFANNTEGQCGTCTNNPKDECRLPGGAVVASCSDMSWHWKVTNPDQPTCHGPPPTPPEGGPTTAPTPCPPSPVCQLILSDVFKPCHATIPPRPYYEGCVFDRCHVAEPDVACSGLALYASLCAAQGLCVDWRGRTNHTCPFTCPADKEYRPCGPSNPSYCYGGDGASLQALKDISPITEGCFCPEGMTLFSTSTEVCVPAGCPRCQGPHGEPVEPGRTVTFDCQECTCEGATRTMSCRRQPCPPPPACLEPGLVPVPVAPAAGQCCPQYTCACNASYCPALPGCPEGSLQTVNYEEGACCPSQKCGWTVCSVNGTLYQPGTVISSSLCQTCRCEVPSGPQADAFRISCETETCGTHCPIGFEYRAQSGRCCGTCVQVACVRNASDGSAHLFFPGESWSDSASRCVTHHCEKHRDGLEVVTLKKTCPPLACPANQTRLSEDGCCLFCPEPPIQNRSTCAVYRKLEVIRVQGCSSAGPVPLAYCKGNCGDTTSVFSLAAGALERTCSCCRELRASPRNVTLRCVDGSRRAFSYTQVEECGCAGLQCDIRSDLGQRRAEGPLRSQDAARRRWSRGARATQAA